MQQPLYSYRTGSWHKTVEVVNWPDNLFEL
jgi:hypothetical protein